MFEYIFHRKPNLKKSRILSASKNHPYTNQIYQQVSFFHLCFSLKFALCLAEQYVRNMATDIRVSNLRILATLERLAQLPSSQICKSQERNSLGHVSISEQVNWGQVLKWHEKVPASSRAECGRITRRW